MKKLLGIFAIFAAHWGLFQRSQARLRPFTDHGLGQCLGRTRHGAIAIGRVLDTNDAVAVRGQ